MSNERQTHDALRDALIERMLTDDVEDSISALALAAWDGPDALQTELEGAATVSTVAETRESKPQTEAAARRSYLKRISVRGFRGIGEEATLELPPGNGLTLVLGRNGSGKSSFAEGAEMLLTGENARWKDKTSDWKDGWRNLHADVFPTLTAEFVVEGLGQPVVARRSWTSADMTTSSLELDGPAGAGNLKDLGWEAGLATYRPFLPYSELSHSLDKPSQLHDAVVSVLGLERLDEVGAVLNAARRDLDKRRKSFPPAIDRVRGLLSASDDPRAEAALEGLLAKKLKRETIEAVLAGADSAESSDDRRDLERVARLHVPAQDEVSRCVSDLRAAHAEAQLTRATAAEHAHAVAALLRAAVAAHDTSPEADACHVCGTPGVLSPRWRAEATGRADALEQDAQAYQQAQARLTQCLREAKALVNRAQVPRQPVAGIDDACETVATASGPWMSAANLTDPIELADAIESSFPDFAAAAALAKEAARNEMSAREDEWAKLAFELRGLLKEAEAVVVIDEQVKRLKAARTVVLATLARLRDDRFSPVAEQAKSVWSCLRGESNVSLVELALSGTGPKRKLDLSIEVDQVPGVAVGVMSQGELHALALSLFLPRAALDASPFGFMIIDDPVQSMDAERVDGLARALESASADRQVIVFTHDDRLFEAVRRLKIPATVKRVERDLNSKLRVVEGRDPIRWYIDDAMGLVHDRYVGRSTIQRVVPGLCRLALDTALCDAFRRNMLDAGRTHHEIDDALDRHKRLVTRASLVLFGDANHDGRAVATSIESRFDRGAADAFFAANRGAHSGQLPNNPKQFVRDCERLARGLEQL